MPVVTVRADPLPYADWRAWRALRAAPATVKPRVTRTPCFVCNRIGWGFEIIPRRHSDLARMAIEDRRRPPFLLPVACDACAGLGHTEHVVAVVVG